MVLEKLVGKRSIVVGPILLKILHYDTVQSTMDLAKIHAIGKEYWTCIVADKQTTGRGTHGRTWVAENGTSLLLSLTLPPPDDLKIVEHISLDTAKILESVLRRYIDLPFHIKSPNDLLIEDRKCAGILFESVVEGTAMKSLILGMGVNIHQSEDDFKIVGLSNATSLYNESNRTIDQGQLLNDFLNDFVAFYQNMISHQKNIWYHKS